MKLNWTPIRIKLGQIQTWEPNPRVSTKAQAQRLIDSERKFGQPLPFLVEPLSRNGMYPLLDGHQRLAAWLTIYGADYEVDAMVASRPLADREHRELVVTLHTGATGSWDWDVLSSWDVSELREWGMDENALKEWNNDALNLREMLMAETVETVDAEPPIDRAEELREKWGTARGQVWCLGKHRLMCGDCTDAGDVARLMGAARATLLFTDPPYGVSIGAKNRFLNSFQRAGRNLDDLDGDDGVTKKGIELREMLTRAFRLARESVCADNCSVFVCAPQGGDLGLMMMMMDAGLPVRHVINWVKNQPTFSMGRLDYDYQHEPILFTWTKTHKRKRDGMFQTSLWMVDKPRASVEHPTMKPVELYINALLNHTDDNDVLYDPFCGSGTAIIAAENTGRVCYAMEIEPKYVAVTLERASTVFPGLEIRLNE